MFQTWQRTHDHQNHGERRSGCENTGGRKPCLHRRIRTPTRGVSNERIVLQLLHVDQSDDAEVTRWGNKDTLLNKRSCTGTWIEHNVMGQLKTNNRPEAARSHRGHTEKTLFCACCV